MNWECVPLNQAIHNLLEREAHNAKVHVIPVYNEHWRQQAVETTVCHKSQSAHEGRQNHCLDR